MLLTIHKDWMTHVFLLFCVAVLMLVIMPVWALTAICRAQPVEVY